MTQSTFKSGRTGQGGAYVSDKSGSYHTEFMRLTAKFQAPLALFAGWFIVGLAGKSYEAARAELAHPFPAIVLIAFIASASQHARYGMESIIDDYVHDRALKQKAMLANKWLTTAFGAAWILALLLIAAPR
jgi:succinate dehydrogenase / fumarate reductase membrane anchor subunit